MLDDLERDDEATRLTTIFNLSDHLPPLNLALPVVSKAFGDQAGRVRDRALTASARLVERAEEHDLVQTCESSLRQDPADLAALSVLLHFYRSERGRAEAYRESRHALILRVIEEIPDFPSSLGVWMWLSPEEDSGIFEQAKDHWLKQVKRHSDNPRVLENAARFFRFVDDAMAGKLLRRCKDLDPSNARWSRELGLLYSFQGDPEQPESRNDWGRMSLAELETALRSATDPNGRFLALLRIPTTCLNAGEIEKARSYAEELLLESRRQEHAFMQTWGDREANMVLGWCALANNDFGEAKSRLLFARVPDAAYLGSSYCHMDPVMHLVGWMLDRGQREVVLEYLARDQALVPAFRDRLASWSSEIEQGLRPNLQDEALLRANVEIVKRSMRSPDCQSS